LVPVTALLLMQILVTNDDRYLAPGIRILADARSVINNMTLVAPDYKSGLSNSLMLMRPLQVQKKTKDNDRVDVTPTDYVYLAIPGGEIIIQMWPYPASISASTWVMTYWFYVQLRQLQKVHILD
jgi:hypothetical protein